jgi:hypothetical protein
VKNRENAVLVALFGRGYLECPEAYTFANDWRIILNYCATEKTTLRQLLLKPPEGRKGRIMAPVIERSFDRFFEIIQAEIKNGRGEFFRAFADALESPYVASQEKPSHPLRFYLIHRLTNLSASQVNFPTMTELAKEIERQGIKTSLRHIKRVMKDLGFRGAIRGRPKK